MEDTMAGQCKHDFIQNTEREHHWNCRFCGAAFLELVGYIDEEKLHSEQADRVAEEIMRALHTTPDGVAVSWSVDPGEWSIFTHTTPAPTGGQP